MRITATQFRNGLAKILDHVIETGEPVEITYKGETFMLVCDEPVPSAPENENSAEKPGPPA